MFKKILYLTVFLSFLWFVGCSPYLVQNLGSQGKNIICFGDSLTSGGGASPGNDYPSLLARAVSLPVINAGVSGNTTYTARERIKRDVLDRDPLIVIVLLGGNDFLERLPKKKTFRNLDAIVARIQEGGAIVVLGEIRAGLIMRNYAPGYRKIAKKRGALLIPNLLGGILDNPNLRSDSIHPNDEGYRIMAQKILKAIRPLIPQGQPPSERR